MPTLEHTASYSILRYLLAELEHVTHSADLDEGYTGSSRAALEEELCKTGILPAWAFRTAFEELENNGLIGTGPQEAIENEPCSVLFIIGLRSSYEYSHLTTAGYKLALANNSTSAQRNLGIILTQMDLDFFFPDQVRAVSSDGRAISELRAQVNGTNEMLVYGDSVPLQVGDQILRKLRNGIEESYEILDAHFQAAHGTDLPAVTQLRVQKQGSVPRAHQASTHIHVTGVGARVNLNSTDSSSNTYHVNADELFQRLFTAIDGLHPGADKDALNASAENLRSTVGTQAYPPAFSRFIEAAKTFMPLITPFLPELSKHLG